MFLNFRSMLDVLIKRADVWKISWESGGSDRNWCFSWLNIGWTCPEGTERRSAGGHKRRRFSNCYCHRPTWEHQETGSGGPSDIRILTIYLPVLFFIFCIFVCIKKIIRCNSRLNLFLICSYFWGILRLDVLIKLFL